MWTVSPLWTHVDPLTWQLQEELNTCVVKTKGKHTFLLLYVSRPKLFLSKISENDTVKIQLFSL